MIFIVHNGSEFCFFINYFVLTNSRNWIWRFLKKKFLSVDQRAGYLITAAYFSLYAKIGDEIKCIAVITRSFQTRTAMHFSRTSCILCCWDSYLWCTLLFLHEYKVWIIQIKNANYSQIFTIIGRNLYFSGLK